MPYSESHDRNVNPKSKRSARPTPTPVNAGTPPQKTLPTNPGSGTPTLDQRALLRKKQLEGLPEKTVNDEIDHRRRYETIDGVNYSEPHVLPPRDDLRKPNSLPDIDIDKERIASGERIAVFEPGTEELVKVDQMLTTLTNDVRSFMDAVRSLKQRMASETPEVQHHAAQMEEIVSQAVYPWLQEVDSHLEDILKAGVSPLPQQ